MKKERRGRVNLEHHYEGKEKHEIFYEGELYTFYGYTKKQAIRWLKENV